MRFMKQRENPGLVWQTIFNEQRAVLTVAAEMVLHREVPPEKILSKALTALDGSQVHEAFGLASAIRAVVKAATAHNSEVRNSSRQPDTPNRIQPHVNESFSIEVLPWPERAVYFLRRVLVYSRRDTALLLGLTDANIDQLCDFAERRLGCTGNSPSTSLVDLSRTCQLATFGSSQTIGFD